MYWEALFPNGGSPDSSIIEELAQYVQWAQYGILMGASENEDTIRYNLNQFWNEKQSYYYTVTDRGRTQMDQLDATANALLNALDTGKTYSAPPSVASQLYTMVTGGTPSRPAADAASAEAKQAALAAADAAGRSGNTSLQSYYQQLATETDANKSASGSLWSSSGILNSTFGGIPLWVYGVGVLLVGGLFFLQERK
jgi:hypothetical protein